MNSVDGGRTDGVEHVRRLVQSFRSVERVVAGQLDLNHTDAAAMELLARLGPLTPKDLAAHLGVTPAAVTFVIDRLEVAGHVRRASNPADRRSTLIQIAASATEGFARVMRPVGARMNAFFDALEPAPRATLLSQLDELSGILQDSLPLILDALPSPRVEPLRDRKPA